MVYSEDSAIKKYLGRLSTYSQKNVRSALKLFFRWIDENGGEFSGMSPSELDWIYLLLI